MERVALLERGLAYRELPTPDFGAPSTGDIEAAVAFIGEHVDKGGHVYVHCNGGKGRSAVGVIAFLMARDGLSAEEAYSLVRAERKIASMMGVVGRLKPQWRALLAHERRLRRRQ